MKTFFSEDHRLHFPLAELSGGELVTPYERPSRIEYVLARLKALGFPAVTDPDPMDHGPFSKLLDAGYLDFLTTAWGDWKAAENAGELIVKAMPRRHQTRTRNPCNIWGRAGYYCHTAETVITGDTWAAAQFAMATARSRCFTAGVM